MVRVKICGVKTLEDALFCCDAGADAIGFNFSEESKTRNRYVDPEEAQRIVEALPPFVMTVGVCVNEAPERVCEYLEFLDAVQFHGEESPETCSAVGRRAIKAFRAGPDFDPRIMLNYAVSAYLLDASVPGARGGTGQKADWNAAKAAVALGRPVILAGGLTPENVGDAVAQVGPYAVDTASGVEDAPGRKNHERIRDFIRNAKASAAR